MHGTRTDHRTVNDTELFASFFSQATGEHLTEEEETTFASVVDTVRQREREVIL
jgi:DNA repair protein SbcD/Mre11